MTLLARETTQGKGGWPHMGIIALGRRLVGSREIAIRRLWEFLTIPVAISFILQSRRMHSDYGMTWIKKMRLGLRMFVNTVRVESGSSFRGHLVMALKLLETTPDVRGIVIECGTWKGASAANLSLVCKLVGRQLKIFDSFQGLPAPLQGWYSGSLDEVKENIRRYGALECCEFVPGWFEETLPRLDEPVLLAWLDVDLHASLETCVRYIWPKLVDEGYMFTDECWKMNYVSLFWSEKWWRKNFDRNPPGLIGAGTGLGLGNFYVGPKTEYDDHPLQHPGTCGYTRKSFNGGWEYYPDEK
ncbi:MAG: TylF/MycF/NovP-related O-methyltransferase [Nitrososphaerales archaeon]